MKRRKGLAFILALSLVLSSFSVAFATDVAEETTPVTETTTEAVAPVATATNTAFADIAGHWAKDAIVKWADYGVVKGSDGVFRPDAPLTRAEMATVLSNLMDYKVAAKNNFSDVATGAWYADAVLKANAAGVLSGDGSGLASPSANITREQAISMLARAFAVADANGTSSSLTDTQNISSWARPAVFGMEAAGYVRGFEGKFNPKNNITRAEVMTIINSAVKAYYTAAGTYTENVDGLAVVKVPGVVLKDVVISGNLIAAEGIASGDLTLDGKTEVKGKLIVRGGGENSIIIKGSAAVLSIEVSKVDGKMRIFADGALIKEITALKGEIILEGNFTNVEVKADATVIIKGNVGTLSMESKGTVDIQSGTVTTLDIPAGATATIAANATVTTANITGAADIKGTGAIGTANISGTGATIVQTPTAVNVADGGAATVGGKTVDGATSAAPSTGGGRGNSSNTVAVSAISVDKEATTLPVGTSETLVATVSPSDATNKAVTWTTSDASVATVADGVVTTVSEGTATITATSNNGKTATTTVTVVAANTVAMIGTTQYDTLKEAIAAVQDNETVKLLADASGDGIVVSSNSNFTLDLNGNTYTVDGQLVGSSGTETNGFQLLKGSDITIKNGTITTTNAKMLIQNYSNLTLDNVELTGASMTQYVLSNNNGATTLKNGTKIKAVGDNVAFDVYYWPSNGYNSVSVEIVDSNVVINGKVEYASDGSEGFEAKAALIIPEGYELAAPAGFKWVAQDGKQVLTKPKTVAVSAIKITEANQDLKVGATLQLNVTFTPEKPTNQKVAWESSNDEIATVSNTGLVTAVAKGEATITVTTDDGGKTNSVAITVVGEAVEPIIDATTYLNAYFEKGNLEVEFTFRGGGTGPEYANYQIKDLDSIVVSIFNGEKLLAENSMQMDKISDTVKNHWGEVSIFVFGRTPNNQWSWDYSAYPLVGDSVSQEDLPTRLVLTYKYKGDAYRVVKDVNLNIEDCKFEG